MKNILFLLLVTVSTSIFAQTNCVSTATLNIEIQECISTKDVSALSAFSVTPNPNDGRFVVTLASAQTGAAHITVADALGRTILEQDAQLQAKLTLPLNLNDVPKGAYWVSVRFLGYISTKQVIIE